MDLMTKRQREELRRTLGECEQLGNMSSSTAMRLAREVPQLLSDLDALEATFREVVGPLLVSWQTQPLDPAARAAEAVEALVALRSERDSLRRHAGVFAGERERIEGERNAALRKLAAVDSALDAAGVDGEPDEETGPAPRVAALAEELSSVREVAKRNVAAANKRAGEELTRREAIERVLAAAAADPDTANRALLEEHAEVLRLRARGEEQAKQIEEQRRQLDENADAVDCGKEDGDAPCALGPGERCYTCRIAELEAAKRELHGKVDKAQAMILRAGPTRESPWAVALDVPALRAMFTPNSFYDGGELTLRLHASAYDVAPRLLKALVPAAICGEYDVTIDEAQRQMIAMALAELSFRSPGFGYAIGQIADLMPDGRAMVERFRRITQPDAAPLAK